MTICDPRPIAYGIYLRNKKKYRYEFDIKLILFILKIKNYIELSYKLNNFSNSSISNERCNVLKLLLSYMYVRIVCKCISKFSVILWILSVANDN